jgi:uncharacterized DUF497 family protein
VEFRWNEWNIDHIAEHGVRPEEAEVVVRNARRPYPKRHMEGKWLVRGRGFGGRLIQVIFIIDDDENETIYVIHARPLTGKEKRRFRQGE